MFFTTSRDVQPLAEQAAVKKTQGSKGVQALMRRSQTLPAGAPPGQGNDAELD
jgi:hypothetical protein